MDKIVVDLPDGRKLVAEPSSDPLYPGIYVTVEGTTEECVSVPTILMEHDENLRVIVWGDKNREDYTHKIVFE